MYNNLPVRDATSLVVGRSPHISKLLVDINSDSNLELMDDNYELERTWKEAVLS